MLDMPPGFQKPVLLLFRHPIRLLCVGNSFPDRAGRVCGLLCGERDFPIVHFADIQDAARPHV